ncbi:hypothetical protein WDV85_05595 [Pseudokineococcus sp. 5B2Z-1]|uniref:hypothetical protein n=1 Tax=Pseudokineococcus sp. 5B2Z-1 TaxID=3132744 RepID=UPI00309AAEA5
MAGGMTAGRGPRRGEPVARTAAGGALLGRSGPDGGPGGAHRSGRAVPSGPSAPPPVEEHEAPGDDRPAADPAELRRAHRHCWVLPDEPGEGGEQEEPFAGVVAEWRLGPTGWLARVVYALGDGEMATVVESWLGADQLRPA